MVKWPKYFHPLILMKIGGWIDYHLTKMRQKIPDKKFNREGTFSSFESEKFNFTSDWTRDSPKSTYLDTISYFFNDSTHFDMTYYY
jgi:hypothetical protein